MMPFPPHIGSPSEVGAPPPFVINVDDTDGFDDVVDALALRTFVAGTQPWSHSRYIGRLVPEAQLRPSSGTIERCATVAHRTVSLVSGPGWTLHVSRFGDESARLSVTATSDALARDILDEACAGAECEQSQNEESVVMGFWRQTGMGAVCAVKPIAAQPWDAVCRNYNAEAAAALSSLMDSNPDDLNGRLLLLHGPPGTGKTSALRSLGHAWRSWCHLDCVLDAERLLGDPSYLLEAAMGHGDRMTAKGWRMLILEDCDELINADAGMGGSQSLSRLLNLTDGLLGQSLNVMVCVTTNVPLTRLHPPLLRPGRCLAQIEIGRLSASEATEWLGRSGPVDEGGATLAELYAIRNGTVTRPTKMRRPTISVGAYL